MDVEFCPMRNQYYLEFGISKSKPQRLEAAGLDDCTTKDYFFTDTYTMLNCLCPCSK